MFSCLHADIKRTGGAREQFSLAISNFLRDCKFTDVDPSRARAVIEIVQLLRTKDFPGCKTHFERNCWLDINFFDLASTALKFKMYSSAVLFTEIDWYYPFFLL